MDSEFLKSLPDDQKFYVCLLQNMLKETSVKLKKAEEREMKINAHFEKLCAAKYMVMCQGDCKLPFLKTHLCCNSCDASKECIKKFGSGKECEQCGDHLCEKCFDKMSVCEKCG
jgi:hypothetical protein